MLVYGHDSSIIQSYVIRASKLNEVDHGLDTKDTLLKELCAHLWKAQQQMVQSANHCQ